MKKLLLVVAALALALIIAVAALPSLRAMVIGIPLRYDWRAGQVATYRNTIQGKFRLNLTGMPSLPSTTRALIGQDVPFKVDTKSTHTVKSVDPGGVAEIEVKPMGGYVELSFQGKVDKAVFDPQPPTIVRYDATGKMVVDPGTAASPQERLAMEALTSFGTGTLPGDRRRTGSTWIQSVSSPFEIQQMKLRLVGESTGRFSGVESRSGALVANIASDETLKLEVEGLLAAALQISGTVKSTGNRWFDWTAGKMRGVHSQGTIDLKGEVPGGSATLVGSYTTDVESD